LTQVKIKFCGITRLEDAERAVVLGADALGFVFFEGSPRYVDPAAAAEIIRQLPPFVCKVGLFVNLQADRVREIVDATCIDLVQYHGDETPEICAAGPQAWMKAIRVKTDMDIAAESERYRGARAIFLDAYDETAYGGTGRQIDWHSIPRGLARPVILAGGLTADNVAAAIAAVQPYAVDVSGGIESSKGIKDPAEMQRFIAEVRRLER
jgi:phosphoribosylanthranilate isomerase